MAGIAGRSFCSALALVLLSAMTAPASALPSVGAPAPQFSAITTDGKPAKLSDFAGKLLVLEWSNKDCPFVRKHYSSGNMQATQAAIAKMGGAWIQIVSSAAGREGFVKADEANALVKSEGAIVSAIILDPSGAIGHLFGASATPHMFVIDAEQTLRYMGAIDDRPSANPSSLNGATNYVLAAADSISAGREVAVKETAAYGCSVKY
ncbi:MAG TPA: redoxin domain-containing protein [Alphaproteobacteria bacterium]|nr:redoxin domain-containing protein [Alphaproteobacteria bacterium]